MSAPRVDMDRLLELVRLHRMGEGCREVGRLLGMSPKTELRYRQVLRGAGLLEGSADDLPDPEDLRAAVAAALPPSMAPKVSSSVDPWMEQIRRGVDRGASPKAIFDKLARKDPEFSGSYQAVKRACRRILRSKGVQPEDVSVPVETAAGQVAQVDFGYVGKLFDPDTGRLRKAWVFVLVLGYSRHLFARVVFDQKTRTWLRLHVEAFEALGGVPAVVVPDNLKAAVVRTAFGKADREKLALNRSYRELARFYGCKIDPTPPRSPEKKGKVESAVKYVKRNFFASSEFDDIQQANTELADWVEKTAGQRIHGTTGRRPLVVFREEERSALEPLPRMRYQLVEWKRCKVHRDCHVEFDRHLYSVPWQTLGQEIWVRAKERSIEIYLESKRIATHVRSTRGRRSTQEQHLPKHRADLRHRCEDYWVTRADRLGPEVGAFVRAVFESDDVLSKLRDVQAIVTLFEGYPRHRAIGAARRASYFGNYSYRGVRRILRNAMDLLELPSVVATSHGRIEQPRFARSVDELLATPLEGSHESN